MQQCQFELALEQRGLERYGDTWARQLELHSLHVAGAAPDTLILVEHEPVITLGRQADAAHLLASEDALAARGVELCRIERGGDITFHGPGQLVGYPILDLRARGLSVRGYVHALEEALIALAARYGIAARRVPGLTGVWVGAEGREDKLAAIGVAVRRGVSFHGFALNVATDLDWFGLIVPCGITGRGVTSLERLLGFAPPLPEAGAVAHEELQQALDSAVQADMQACE